MQKKKKIKKNGEATSSLLLNVDKIAARQLGVIGKESRQARRTCFSPGRK